MHPTDYHVRLLDGVHLVNGKAVAVAADHEAGVITVARSAPLSSIVAGLTAALHSAYSHAHLISGLPVLPGAVE